MTDPIFAASPLAPLEHRAFRALLLMWTLSNLSLWMWNVTASLMMVDLRVPPLWIALVQAALSGPVLLFGLPFGALADMTDRRRLLILTQTWAAALAVAVGSLAAFGHPTAVVLLVATFAFGCGVAMRLPAYGATVPGIVPRPHLASALALNAVCMNTSRIVGPLAAGIVIAQAGLPAAFLVIGVLSCVSILLVRSWQPEPAITDRRPTSLAQSILGGIGFTTESLPFRSVLLRISVFSSSACALPALLPLAALDLPGGDRSTFTLMLATMGSGAVLAMTFLQKLRARISRDKLELAFAIMHGLAIITIAASRSKPIALAAMLFAGISWIGAANSMTVHAQLILPDWVRARGMAIYQMAFMGAMAVGAAIWGQVANVASVHASLGIAGACTALGVAAVVIWLPHTPTEG